MICGAIPRTSNEIYSPSGQKTPRVKHRNSTRETKKMTSRSPKFPPRCPMKEHSLSLGQYKGGQM